MKTYIPRDAFFVGSHNPPDVKNPKWGTPNSQKLALHKFILAILSDVEKSAKASGMIIFRIRAKMGEISPENFAAWPSRIDARRQCSLYCLTVGGVLEQGYQMCNK